MTPSDQSSDQSADPFADLRLTEWTSCGGCAAKWGASLLTSLVRDMPAGADPSLLVGLAPFDDAAIYQVAPDVALVSTTDFFPPLVDHPSDFGAIAAANACSDVFAMGGRVVIAVNVAAFPEHFPREAIVAIFDAAAAVVHFVNNLCESGIYNIGTGKARAFKDLASAVMTSMGKAPNINYIDMPEDLRGKYQYFTEAKMLKLADAGYTEKFHTLEEGVRDYIQNYLLQADPYC